MMSIHSDFFASVRILNALMDIFLNSVQKTGKGEASELWTPSLKDVCTVFLNMGASFQSLFPLQSLQPGFTYEQIISEIDVLRRDCSSTKTSISEHFAFLSPFNVIHVIKFLVFCTNLCPEAYTDHELMLLISVVCRISLERKLQLIPLVDFESLLESLLKNIKDWDSQLPALCLVLSDITDHHHNLLRVVQLLPSAHTRGRELRRHLSLVIISKLLDKKCTYVPRTRDFQASAEKNISL
ncbi:SMC5-SMC6 complex localization factor protein 2-like [Protopterus annectens]|uniref:SMC5-SMC6 complex localization factor protein 2-like n=1 Tax=Protopterus annectens TaxID=7888 RepID=UPI001CFA6ABE|nr:SMC5-SMC6 complex localization factor protein 2-like [Protopterus annectens]